MPSFPESDCAAGPPACGLAARLSRVLISGCRPGPCLKTCRNGEKLRRSHATSGLNFTDLLRKLQEPSLLVADFADRKLDFTEGRGLTPLDPGEPAEARFDFGLYEPGGGGTDAEHLFGQERGRSAGPAVAEAVAQPRVAVLAEIAVDIVLARNRQLVDAVGVARPLQIEGPPRRSSAPKSSMPPQ